MVRSDRKGSEWEFHTKTNEGEVAHAAASEVVSAVSEDADAARGRNAEVKTTTDQDVTSAIAVGAEATASQCVGSNADAGDRIAQDQSCVEVVVLFVSRIQTIRGLDRHERAERVFGQDATAEVGVTINQCATEDAEGETRSEAIASRWWWWWHDWAFRALIGNRAGESSTCEGNGCEEGHE